jgi:hypothetical protein
MWKTGLRPEISGAFFQQAAVAAFRGFPQSGM